MSSPSARSTMTVEDENREGVGATSTQCRALANDFVIALERRRRTRDLGRLACAAAESAHESEPGEAAAAAQAVIALRRGSRGA